ncbi:MAG TPA: RdgB/HAM1 family non-canonical purine NTP pyrophosphatase [Spirochaetales bacterium]|nr:RdgB/HAM1 family non-canonical purine NTP pyrophosphatase [Spirochaetales bacterium]HPS14293.1 RdgB/HAM1 family non-canonical purine NTP pyrophosphatase [Spirochaetales bacterium]
MDLVVATFNEHKLQELRGILPDHHLLSPQEVGLSDLVIEETGLSYHENALLKAKAVFDLVHLPTLADDSGLSVAALDGAPGIYSARYGALEGQKLPSEARNQLLLSTMEGVANRSCAFFCCLVLLYGQDKFVSIQETCPGVLLDKPRGQGGFGYDPVVYLPELGLSVAELSPEQKNEVSHRGKAGQKMNLILNALSDILGQPGYKATSRAC